MPGVMQEWLSDLPLREQGVLVLALRGPDGLAKEHGAKNVVRAYRACVMITGATGQALMPGYNLPDDSFMQMYRIGHVDDAPWNEAALEFFRAWDSYNIHFIQHLLHAAQILGERHPILHIAARWKAFYLRGVRALHMNPESREEMIDRLKDGHRPDTPL